MAPPRPGHRGTSDGLGEALRWTAFVGFLSLDFASKAIHRLIDPKSIALLAVGMGVIVWLAGNGSVGPHACILLTAKAIATACVTADF